MDLQINSKSHVPVHVQLEGQIKHLILSGGFEVGSRLPSIRAMAGFLRVNRNTVARVISDLEREGYVESRRGSGVYVVEPPDRGGGLEAPGGPRAGDGSRGGAGRACRGSGVRAAGAGWGEAAGEDAHTVRRVYAG